MSGLVLRLLMRESSSMKKIDEICLHVKKAIIKFSYDGSLFAFYFKDQGIFKICRVDNIEIDSFITKIRTLENDEDNYFSVCKLDQSRAEEIEEVEFD